MAYTDDTPMNALLAGMATVEPEACQAFARRQHRSGHTDELAAAAALIHDLAFNVQLDRPEELVRWKYPESFEPIDTDMLVRLLQAASDDDRDSAHEIIAAESFTTVTALSSIATHLRQSIEHIRRYGGQASDPQQSLF